MSSHVFACQLLRFKPLDFQEEFRNDLVDFCLKGVTIFSLFGLAYSLVDISRNLFRKTTKRPCRSKDRILLDLQVYLPKMILLCRVQI